MECRACVVLSVLEQSRIHPMRHDAEDHEGLDEVFREGLASSLRLLAACRDLVSKELQHLGEFIHVSVQPQHQLTYVNDALFVRRAPQCDELFEEVIRTQAFASSLLLDVLAILQSDAKRHRAPPPLFRSTHC